MDFEEIKNVLPHRYPFILVDKVLKKVEGQSGVGIKNVTINEPYFQGHFPGAPIVPGVMIIESCAQLVGLVCADSRTSIQKLPANKNQYLALVKEFNFKQPVIPGDVMQIEVKIQERRFNLIQAETRVKTKKGLVAFGTLVITDRKE